MPRSFRIAAWNSLFTEMSMTRVSVFVCTRQGAEENISRRIMTNWRMKRISMDDATAIVDQCGPALEEAC
jgi:hypothetical protein